MTENIDILKEFGVTEKEAKLYLALLKLGSATSGELMRELGYYSKTIYQILDKLMAKGLVSYIIKANIKYFEAVDPEKFLDILKEQEVQLKTKEEKIKKIMPELKAIRKLAKAPQEANVYVGKKGLKSIFEDQLKQKGEILVLGGGGNFKRAFEFYYDQWHKKRIKEKIKLKLLWNEKLRNKKKEILRIPLLEVKFLPKEFDNPAPAIIYNDKVAITIWSEIPIATLIRSKEVANSYRSYFKLLWGIAKK